MSKKLHYKLLLLLLLNILLISSIVKAQTVWTTQYQNAGLFMDVFFINPDTGWVFTQGEPLFTTDGGANWAFQSVNIQGGDLFAGYFNNNLGWMVGDGGKIFSTTDWGNTWSPQSNLSQNFLLEITFTDSLNGWIVGGAGIIYHTSNGGVSWSIQISGSTENLEYVDFVDANTGWAVGAMGTILKTTDGGTTWVSQASNTTETVWAVDFINADTGWAAAKGEILHTIDGGLNWTTQWPGTGTYSLSNELRDINFANKNAGWAVSLSGSILATSNGGITWENQNSGTTSMLWGVYFISPNSGWAVGHDGTILHTTNGVGQSEQQPIKDGEVNIFPNPFSNKLTVRVSGNNPISAYRLYDVQGNIVRDKSQLSGFVLEISQENLTAGVYLLELERADGVISRQRIIVQ